MELVLEVCTWCGGTYVDPVAHKLECKHSIIEAEAAKQGLIYCEENWINGSHICGVLDLTKNVKYIYCNPENPEASCVFIEPWIFTSIKIYLDGACENLTMAEYLDKLSTPGDEL